MHLSTFIVQNMDAILREWDSYAQAIMPEPTANTGDLREHAKEVLRTIAEDLRTPQSDENSIRKSKGYVGRIDDADTAAEQHAATRLLSGFSIEQLVAEYRALRASVLRLWKMSNGTALQSDLDDMTRFNEAVDQAVAESIARCSSMVRQAQHLSLAILGHDLRNPLGAITMSALALTQDPMLSSSHAKVSKRIYNSGIRMSKLVDDLLDFTRIRLGQGLSMEKAEADLAEIAIQATEELRDFYPDRTILFESAGAMKGSWDSLRIGQALSNLLGNAIEHGDAMTPISITLHRQGAEIVVRVHNSGNPIPADEIQHIFDPLTRYVAGSTPDSRTTSSLGLGLHIAREIIQSHGGTLTVKSSADEGTTFIATLACHQASS